MSFVTPALLGGIALIAIPIALHLIMRRQPKSCPSLLCNSYVTDNKQIDVA